MAMHKRYAPYREGYFMSAEDQKAEKARIVLNYAEERERYSTLKSQVDRLASGFENLTKLLRKDPERVSVDKEAGSKEFEDLFRLVEDLKATKTELQRLHALAVEGGFASLLLSENPASRN